MPDPNLARELNSGKRARTIGRHRVRSPELKAMREEAAQSDWTDCKYHLRNVAKVRQYSPK